VSDQLFIVLRVCLLALVYLVFLRVLRAVWVELRAENHAPVGSAAPAPAPQAAYAGHRPVPTPAVSTMISTGAARLVVTAPSSLAGHSFALEGETTIGRGAGCGVPIDDAHVSKVHARVSPTADGWTVEDLSSTNGTMVEGEFITRPTPIAPGGRITIGEVILELA
jgi:pSer/pThr/pTyr-binding forkhead associated (FHA) protein